MRIGFIGTGNLGSMLIRSFIKGNAISEENINIINRSPKKAKKIKEEYTQIKNYTDHKQLVQDSDLIFLCVKPLDLKDVLEKTGRNFSQDKLIISTLLAPPLADLERIIKGKIIRIYPSVTQSTQRGAALYTWGKEVKAEDKGKLIPFLKVLGSCYELPEHLYRAAGDITSCGPAFMAAMVGALAREAVVNGVPVDTANEMAVETMLGTALLLQENRNTFEELVKKVATPGGCTAEGLKVLNKDMDQRMSEVYGATCKREEEIVLALRDLFSLK